MSEVRGAAKSHGGARAKTVDRSLVYQGGKIGFLLLHGLGGTPVELRVVARGLHRAGFTVHCPQLAGHCGTEADLLATTWQDWAASAGAGLDRLRQDCDTVIVGGLSMGAILALHLAAERCEDVQGLALYAPTLWYDGWAMPWYRFLLKLLIDTPMGRRFRFVEKEPYGIKDRRIRSLIATAMERGDSADAGLHGTPSGAVRQFWRLIDRVKAAVPSIRKPALVIQAREDDLSSLANSLYLQRKLGGIVDAVVLDDCYHMVTIDRQSDVVIARSITFAQWLAGRLEPEADDCPVRSTEAA